MIVKGTCGANVTAITRNNALYGALLGLFLLGAVVASNGCVHIPGGAVPSPTGGFPSSGPTPTPVGTCATQQANTTQFIDISQGIAASIDPVYGALLGYALDPQNGTFPTMASRITLRPSDLVQFVNIDADISYSAVGLGATPPKAPGYVFPPGTQNPLGHSIVNNGVWSTGRLQPANAAFGTLCYSQQFNLNGGSTGTPVWFGDHDRFNATNGTFRDILLVSNSAPQARHRRVRPPAGPRRR